MDPQSKRILVVLGTRPEAIKLAPVIRTLRSRARVTVCSTGQHREMLRDTLAAFGIEPDIDLDLMQPDQRLSELLARMTAALPKVLDETKPDWIVVQGDTLTVMGAALCGFLEGTPVAHVEAGLRTEDKRIPFPEEASRRLVSVVADRHFAPTESAAQALLAEGHDPSSVLVTGNTGIDAVLWMRDLLEQRGVKLDPKVQGRVVLVTAHRRESFGDAFRELCQGLRELVETHPDIELVYPVHLNPNVQKPVREILGGVPRVHLLAPQPYPQLTAWMLRADLILTDSGGIQEEAPTLGKPVLVLREETERPDAVNAGLAKLVGTDRRRIVEEASRLLNDPQALSSMARPTALFGDGKASQRIAAVLLDEDSAPEAFRAQ